MATKHNFVALKGETFSIKIPGMTQNGQPYDLTGHTVILVFKDKDNTVLEEYSVLVNSMPVTIKVPVAEVDSWPLGNNKFHLAIEQPNGDVRIPAYGAITVKDVD